MYLKMETFRQANILIKIESSRIPLIITIIISITIAIKICHHKMDRFINIQTEIPRHHLKSRILKFINNNLLMNL